MLKSNGSKRGAFKRNFEEESNKHPIKFNIYSFSDTEHSLENSSLP